MCKDIKPSLLENKYGVLGILSQVIVGWTDPRRETLLLRMTQVWILISYLFLFSTLE